MLSRCIFHKVILLVPAFVVFFSSGLIRAEGEEDIGSLKESAWWENVRKSIMEQEYEITWQEDMEALHAANRASNLRAYFREGGVELVPRTGEIDWQLDYALLFFGRETAPVPVGTVTPRAEGRRVEYHRNGISEWYENREEGIEQGFVIGERPGGDGLLVIQGNLSGDLEAHPASDGQSISFIKDGKVALRYEKLVVKNADGRELSSRLVLEGELLSIIIEEDGRYPIHVDPLLTGPSWMAEGNQEEAEFGFSVASAGDVNGDGFSDVIVGAPEYDNGQTNEGRAYVYHGGSSGLLATADWTAESNQTGAHFGYSVASAGNVNGDNYSDVIVGAPYYDNGQTDEGCAYVYHGGASGIPSSTANWTAESNSAGAEFGTSVASAGNVNGDSYSDVIVGAPKYTWGQTNEGRVYVYHGGASGIPSSTANWTTQSNQAGAEFGTSVASAGNVNGDGYSDIIVGAPYYDNGQTNEGRASVYHGGASGIPSSTAAWTAESDQSSAFFGYSVASAGNVNGDSYSDVIVGAPGYNVGIQVDAGRAYVYHGGASGLPSPATANWTVDSDQSSAYLGWSVASAGDVNWDGYSDVIVGAKNYTNGQSDEGRAYLYCGRESGLSPVANWTAESNQGDSHFGWSVASAGDVNSDGCSDIIVGAYWYDNGETDEGRAYVYHGNPCCIYDGDPALFVGFAEDYRVMQTGETHTWTIAPCNFGPASTSCPYTDTFCVQAWDTEGFTITGDPPLGSCIPLDPGYLWWQDICLTVPCDAEVCDFDTLYVEMFCCDEVIWTCRTDCPEICDNPNVYDGSPFYSADTVVIHVIPLPPGLYILQDSLCTIEQGQTSAYVPFTICNGNPCADETVYDYTISCTPMVGALCTGFPQSGSTDPIPGGECEDVHAVVDAGLADVCDLAELKIVAWDASTGSTYDTCMQVVHVIEQLGAPLVTTPVVTILVIAMILAAAIVLRRRAASRTSL